MNEEAAVALLEKAMGEDEDEELGTRRWRWRTMSSWRCTRSLGDVFFNCIYYH